MEWNIITVYCLIDEYLKISGIKDDVRAEISNAEILMVQRLTLIDSFLIELYQVTRRSRVRLWSDPSLIVTKPIKSLWWFIFQKAPCTIFMHYPPKESIMIGDKGYISLKLEAVKDDLILYYHPLGIIRYNDKIQKITIPSVELEKA